MKLEHTLCWDIFEGTWGVNLSWRGIDCPTSEGTFRKHLEAIGYWKAIDLLSGLSLARHSLCQLWVQRMQWSDFDNCYQLSSTGNMRWPKSEEVAKSNRDSTVFEGGDQWFWVYSRLLPLAVGLGQKESTNPPIAGTGGYLTCAFRNSQSISQSTSHTFLEISTSLFVFGNILDVPHHSFTSSLVTMSSLKSGSLRALRSRAITQSPHVLSGVNRGISITSKSASSLDRTSKAGPSTRFLPLGMTFLHTFRLK